MKIGDKVKFKDNLTIDEDWRCKELIVTNYDEKYGLYEVADSSNLDKRVNILL